MAEWRLRLLGTFQASRDGEPITNFATDKSRALLAYLAVESAAPHTREALTGLLWPDQPQQRASQNLRQALSYLRRALGDRDACGALLTVTRDTIQFNRGAGCRIDASEFAELLDACRAHPHRHRDTCRACAERLRRAMELYRGDFLAQFYVADSQPFEEWALVKREWLRRQAMEALADLAEYLERHGDLAAARDYAWRQAQFDAWDEDAHRRLMRLLAAEGRRSAALAQFETCRKVLDTDLGAKPAPETVMLYERIRSGESVVARTPPMRLPPAHTAFVGRETELAELAELLAAPGRRLVTALGPGGIGKTRLVLAAAAEQQGAFAHGVYFVPLDAVASADFLVPAIAEALGFFFQGRVDPAEQLLDHLHEKEMLLVLDGAEHISAGAGLLARIMDQAPGVVLLVSSRERLNLREEWVYALDGLDYPAETPGAATRHSAITLFTQRARQVDRRFGPAEAELPALARICRLVEGMPLGLELAAGWVREKTCAEIAAELERSLDLLATDLRNVPARQRSMRATFEHSWRLLTGEERTAFERLAVFRGGFAAEAAPAVAGAGPAVLAALEDKSLLRRPGGARYQLHELLRQNAEEKLAADSGACEQAHAGHARYYADWLQRFVAPLKGMAGEVTQAEALGAAGAEIDNVRAAWQWAVSRCLPDRPDSGAEAVLGLMAEGLYLFLSTSCWYQEGESAFRQAVVAVEQAGPGRDLLLGRLLAYQARCCEFTAHSDQASQLYERSLALLERLGADADTALPLHGLGCMAYIQGRYPLAEQHLQGSLAIYRRNADSPGAAGTLNRLAEIAYRQGDFAAARRLALEGLALRREIGDLRGIASSMTTLSLAYLRLGEYGAARSASLEALDISRGLGNKVGTANVLTSLSNICFRQGAAAEADRWARESLDLYREIGDQWGVAMVLGNLAHMAMEQGEYARAEPLCRESVAVYRRAGIQAGLANTLSSLGEICHRLGRSGEARRALQESIHIAHAAGARPALLESLGRLALVIGTDGNQAQALGLLHFVLGQPGLGQAEHDKIAGWLEDLTAHTSSRAMGAARAWAEIKDLDEVVRIAEAARQK